MLDYDGNVLKIGQIAITEPESKFVSHTIKIVGFTKKMVKISFTCNKDEKNTITNIKPKKLRIKGE